jgi:hypothetical protein
MEDVKKVKQVTSFKRYRYDFSERCKEDLSKFAERNVDVPRKKYKELWLEWMETHRDMIADECNELVKQGFQGDPLDKMYKSVRYYHRKKDNIIDTIKDPPPNRSYVRLPEELNKCMDNHIHNIITTRINDDSIVEINLTHGESFHNFLEANADIVLNELVEIKKRDGVLDENIGTKLRKRYRDKFYKYRHMIMNNFHV